MTGELSEIGLRDWSVQTTYVYMAGELSIVKWQALRILRTLSTYMFQKNSDLLMYTAQSQMSIQVEKLQDLSYKINPVIKKCQILSRMPAVDEAAGVGARSATHQVT